MHDSCLNSDRMCKTSANVKVNEIRMRGNTTNCLFPVVASVGVDNVIVASLGSWGQSIQHIMQLSYLLIYYGNFNNVIAIIRGILSVSLNQRCITFFGQGSQGVTLGAPEGGIQN